TEHRFPRLAFYRGSRKEKGRFFGPYPSAGAVRDSLHHLQKLFQLRQCEDSFFANRSRPCLQYQIKRCSAPCVDRIDPVEYAQDVEHAVKFLEGKNREVVDDVVKQMDAASEVLDYERAAALRDQVNRLKLAQEKQYVEVGSADADIIAVREKNGLYAISVFFVRGGRSLGSKVFFPRPGKAITDQDVMQAFLPQYYLDRAIPSHIFLNIACDDQEILQQAFSDKTGHKVEIRHRFRGERRRWVKLAEANAVQALLTRLASDETMQKRLDALAEALNLDQPPQRLECFDVSHTSGEATVTSCVVFGRQGAIKSDYRRFNIKDITPGDDYAAMSQALTRRYTRLKKGEGLVPDVLIVDGGKGQLSAAKAALDELQVDDVTLVAVAKGPTRKSGMETLFLSGHAQPIILAADSPALHLVQQIRDEAHRFAITGHTRKRDKKRRESTLQEIAGLGPKRRQALLKQFGGLQGVSRAGVDDLAATVGINQELAERVYAYFHGDKH
ncbi:MAG: excinuclease ABC subunit UvrC, partial [Gammaproteobacteria bacterium]